MGSVSRIATSHQLLSRLKLRHLALLRALVETASVHKAADRLGLTQPAASKLLGEVEATFGVPLFVRSRAGVAPTAYGSALAHKASLLLVELEAAREELEAIARGATGRVRVGVLQVVLPVLVPGALRRLQTQGSGVVVSLHEGTSSALLDGLDRGDYECVLSRLMQGAARPGFHTEVLYEESVHIVARVGHPLARSSRVSAAALARQPWILPPLDAPLRHEIDTYFAIQGEPLPVPVAESVSLLTNEVMLRETDALAPMPRAVAQHYARLGVLTILRFQPPWRLPPVGLVSRARVPQSPPMALFFAAVRAEAVACRDDAAVFMAGTAD